ncbi:hypothetical protein GmRootV213_50110 (plasmid) [Variovorax sp. V213]
MKQQTLAMAVDENVQYEKYRRPTKRDTFLATMEQIVPWAQLCTVIEPCWRRPETEPVGMRLITWTVYAMSPKLRR